MGKEHQNLILPIPHRVIRLNFQAEAALYSLTVDRSDSGSWETDGSITLNGSIEDKSDRSRFDGAGFSLTVLKSKQNELNAELDIYRELNAPTGSPELLLEGGLPPIMGYLILPSDAFDALRLQANLYDERRLHSLTLILPIAGEFYDSEHPGVPVTPEFPVSLAALDLTKKIKIIGCDHFSYSYLVNNSFKQ